MCQAENPATGRVCKKEVRKPEFDFLHLGRHCGERKEKKNKMEREKERKDSTSMPLLFLHVVCLKFQWLGPGEMA